MRRVSSYIRRCRVAPAFHLCVLLLCSTAVSAQSMSADSGSPESMLEQYCFKCHDYDKSAGGVVLEWFNPEMAHQDAELAEKIMRKLRAGMMPPAGEERPPRNRILSFIDTVETVVDKNFKLSYGRPGMHRLNRVEYANAIRDLLAVKVSAGDFLPADDSSRGFDNQAGTLGLSPALLEAYLSAAGKISRMAVGTVTSPTQIMYRVAQDTTQNYHIEGLPFGTRGGLLVEHFFPVDAEYVIKVFSVNLGNMGNFRPFGEVRGEKLEVSLDGGRMQLFDWDKEFGIGQTSGGFSGQLRTIDLRVPVKAGTHQLGVTFLATNYAPGLDLNDAFDRSTIETGGLPGFTFYPHIGSVRVDGPYQAAGAADSASRRLVYSCHPDHGAEELACAMEIVSRLARHAYRGSAGQQDIDTLLDFFKLGRESGTFDQGIEMALQRMLTDPKFIYRIEFEPGSVTPTGNYYISELDLASRLSFFLWSSIPDDELLTLAENGRLRDPGVLEQQVKRMLDDPKSIALAENFAGQWLALRNLDGHAPVVDQFPDFDDNLRQAFRRETELFFDSLIREDRGVLELLTADYTFVNERLARHYGIPLVKGSRFRRVELGDEFDVRRGLLGKGSILTVSSQPGRTSPVIRGNWVLANIIGVPAPDPPPDVPDLEPQPADAAGNQRVPTMREMMESHREDPVCRSCHKLMDPIGFSLETFDAIGKWRTEDGGKPIDAADVMYDGTPIEGPADLRNFLLKYADQFIMNTTENLLIYALGRGVEYSDMPAVRLIFNESATHGHHFRSLILAIVKSDIFQMNSVSDGVVADQRQAQARTE